jgi:hypothetical protein
VLFDRICTENGIRHILTAPYSPTTTGKMERLHKTMRAEFVDLHDREWGNLAAAQDALGAWVVDYNTERPHRSACGRVPAVDITAPAGSVPTPADLVVLPVGVSRWVDQTGAIRLAGSVYRVGSAFAGQQVEAVAARGLIEVRHAGVPSLTPEPDRRFPGMLLSPSPFGSG